MDFDKVSFYTLVNELKRIIAIYNLSDMYIFKSNNGFNVVCLDLISLKDIYNIGIQSIYSDRDFVLYGYDRGYYVLRLGPDKIFEKSVKSPFNNFDKSLAHAELLETIYVNLKIPKEIDGKKDKRFKNNTKVHIIQYPSEKDGYHEVKR